MESWSLAAELLALILLGLITVFYYDKRKYRSNRRLLFEISIGMEILAVVLNGLSSYVLSVPEKFPRGCIIGLNSAYFLITVYSTAVIAAYLFDLLLEHVYRKACRTRAVIGVGTLVIVFTGLVIANLWTGWLFSIDASGGYHRGCLNRAGYVVMVVELCMIFMCYRKNRESVSESARRTIFILFPVVAFVTLLQIQFPQILLNGMIGAFALLIIYVNSQNFRIGRDPLTGIGNRKSFYEDLMLRLHGKEKFLIVTVSLNQFHVVNERYGYKKGDEFIFQIASWLDACQPNGRAFRFGNVTFALICPYQDEAGVQELVDRIRGRFAEKWVQGAIQCGLHASLTTMPCNVFRLEATQVIEILTFLIANAKSSEDGIVNFDAVTEYMFQKEKGIERLVQEAIEKRMFEVWYQPIYNCQKDCFDTVEALLRLRDYKGKLVSPAEFIPIAEKNGMIGRIGQFVWEETCRFLGENPTIPLKCVSINMSAQQFQDAQLCEQMSEDLAQRGISPKKIKLEITERMIFEDEKRMKQQMRRFAEKGFCFAADDFGIGYSNLAGVMHLPFEFIKFDRSLLQALPHDAEDQAVIRNMVSLFHEMGKKIVAEGVETREQQHIVKEMGADYIQGFYYAKPMPEESLLAFLQKNATE